MDKAEVIQAMVACEGLPRPATVMLNTTRRKLLDFIQQDPELVELQNELREGVLDDVENVVIKSAKDGDGANGRFILQTLGKERGFTTRTENTGKDGEPLVPLSDRELARRVLFILEGKKDDD